MLLLQLRVEKSTNYHTIFYSLNLFDNKSSKSNTQLPKIIILRKRTCRKDIHSVGKMAIFSSIECFAKASPTLSLSLSKTV